MSLRYKRKDMMKPFFLFYILFFSVSLINAQNKQDSLFIFFKTDQYVINGKNEEILKSLNKTIEKVRIIGYTDTIGSLEYNDQLSIKRAYSSYYFLLNHGFKTDQIIQVQGKGEEALKLSRSLDSSRRTVIYYINPETKHPEKLKKSIQKETDNKLEEKINSTAIGENLVINNINFYPGSHQHLPQSEADMQALMKVMKNNPNLKIEIQGHICCERMGLDGYDKLTGDRFLSVNRAKHIYDYLIINGIASDRLNYKGLGSSHKLYPMERSEMEKTANRRVEIKIISK